MPVFPSAPPDPLYGRVVIDNLSTKSGVPAVTFDHFSHRAAYSCRVCHVDVGFALKAEETEISAATNRAGLHCGACHNGRTVGAGGKVVFAACSQATSIAAGSDCTRCHTGRSADPTPRYEAFKARLPVDGSGLIDWEAAEREGRIKPSDSLDGVSPRRSKMKLDRDVPIIALGTWLGNISFSHKKHTAWLGCELCHPDVFPLTQRGSTRFSMADINAGRYCGACHNIVAFPLAECRRCHANLERKPLR